MIGYPPALRRTGFGPPRAIARLRDAIAEARGSEPAKRPPVLVAPIVRANRSPGAARRAGKDTHRPGRGRTVIRLWLPLTLLFLLLAPFAVLLSPLIWLAPKPYGRHPFRTVFAFGAVLLSLGGTDVDVDAPGARVQIKIV